MTYCRCIFEDVKSFLGVFLNNKSMLNLIVMHNFIVHTNSRHLPDLNIEPPSQKRDAPQSEFLLQASTVMKMTEKKEISNNVFIF